MRVTIREVAHLAGVGRGTVSRVLNDSPAVDPATRKRVLDAIRDLDFVPSAAARRLTSGRTMSVGVLVPFLTRPSVVERLRGIEEALGGTDYDMIVYNAETPERRDRIFRDVARGHRVDGVMVVSLRPHDAEVARIVAGGTPLVLVDAYHRLLPRVVVDDVLGGRLAAQHAIDLGHRRIAFIGDLPASRFNFISSRLRARGVKAALACAGPDIAPPIIVMGEPTVEAAAELAASLLARPDRPTAIVCASDTQALGVLRAARDAGLRVPEDLSVVGYDDIEIAGHVGLSTIRQPLHESGRRGAALLLEALAGHPIAAVRTTLPVELSIRSTTAPAPATTASGRPVTRVI